MTLPFLRALGLTWALCAAAAPFVALAQSPPIVATSLGTVQGMLQTDVAVFRGVPFAAPPVGELRWREPRAPAPWAGTRQAAANGPSCPQKRGLSLEGGGDPGILDEDCLYLNVFTPMPARGVKLPVMVWIHGGAFIFGSGGLAMYDGAALARRGAVVVTINYRLGPLGFFSHAALDHQRPGGPVNFGLLDQIAALQWVQHHIEAFGGDPARVTVFGQSAGAQSVLGLMTSPLAAGLFRSAIASAVGLPGVRAGADALRRVPAERLVALDGKGTSLAPSLIVGDAAVPQRLLDTFRQGKEASVPLIIGSNSDDASVALAFGIKPEALVSQMGKARIAVRALYGNAVDDHELGREVSRDAVFTAFARRIAYLHSRKDPTFRYYFSHAPASTPGASHGGEVPYAFGTAATCGCLGGPANTRDEQVERRMGDRWFAFASGGRPDGTPEWQPDNRVRGVALEIGDDDALRDGFMTGRLNAIITTLNLAERRVPADR